MHADISAFIHVIQPLPGHPSPRAGYDDVSERPASSCFLPLLSSSSDWFSLGLLLSTLLCFLALSSACSPLRTSPYTSRRHTRTSPPRSSTAHSSTNFLRPVQPDAKAEPALAQDYCADSASFHQGLHPSQDSPAVVHSTPSFELRGCASIGDFLLRCA